LRVAILYSHLKEWGGAENVILKQAELLRGNGYNVKSYFAYVDKQLAKAHSNPHPLVESYFDSPIPDNKIMRIILSIPLAPLTIKAFRSVDVLLCHGYGPAPWIGYVLKKIRGMRYISYIHSPPRFLFLDSEARKLWRFDSIRDVIYLLNKAVGPILKEIDFLGVLNSDRVLVNSFFTARRVKEIYGLEPTVCYPPVDTNMFKPQDDETIRRMRSDFGWPLILSTGRIAAVKRWEWLIEMMTHVVKVFPSATLAVTGEITEENIEYVQKLIKLAEFLGVRKSVRFLGFRAANELVRLYNVADVYAYAVPGEDFGLGPVEAMACGTPAVVWDDGAGPCETVIDGKTGFRAKPYNIEDFAESTMKALDVNKMEMRDFASKFVRENFSCESHFKSLDQVLRNL